MDLCPELLPIQRSAEIVPELWLPVCHREVSKTVVTTVELGVLFGYFYLECCVNYIEPNIE